MKAAVIDIGTNSVKLAVGELTAEGTMEVFAEATTNPRIGEGVDASGAISSDAADRAIAAIETLLKFAQQHGAECIRAVATSAMRDAANRERIAARIRRETRLDVEILSEEEECRLSYLAVAMDPVLGNYPGRQVVADVGGGSSELTFGSGTQVMGGRSVRIGAVRLTERHLFDDPPAHSGLRDAAEEARTALAEAAQGTYAGRVVGVGGSAINLARMLKGIDNRIIEGVHGTVISIADMQDMIARLAHSSVAQRKLIVGLEWERVDIILGGAIILDAVMDVTSAPELVVSARGLRHGILYELLGGKR